MLVNMFPRHVIEFLGVHGSEAVPESVAHLAHRHSDITVLFLDIVGFTPLARDADPQDVMKMLNELFSTFDILCTEHGVYKVNTDVVALLSAENSDFNGSWMKVLYTLSMGSTR